MILNSITQTQRAIDYDVNIEYKDMMLNYRVETLNGVLFNIRKQHYVKLKNSEKKQIKAYITKLIEDIL